MNRILLSGIAAAFLGSVATVSYGEFVDSVVSTSADLGTPTYGNPATNLSNTNSVVGAPATLAGGLPIAAFNSPYEASQVVNVGLGGHLTVHFATPQAANGSQQLGIFAAVGLSDYGFDPITFESTGQASGAPVSTFASDEYGAARTATVEVADASMNFKSLGQITFTNPMQAFQHQTNPYGVPDDGALSDFEKPFSGTLDDFADLNQQQISYHVDPVTGKTVFDGSGGGTWLSIDSSLGLSAIEYVRILNPQWLVINPNDPDYGKLVDVRISAYDVDGNGPNTFHKNADLQVDAIALVPEPVSGMLLLCAAPLLRRRRA